MFQHITTKDYDSKVFFVSRPDKSRKIVERKQPPENMQGLKDRFDRRSHDRVWPERRQQVMTEWAHSVLRFLEPIGFVSPMGEGESLTDMAKTQCMVHPYQHRMGIDCVPADIAPEWLRLQANGVDCVSMYSEYTDEDGETHEMEAEAAAWLCAEAIASTLDANVEAFLREHDRRLWYSSRPKVAYEIVNEQGRRGLVPKVNHPWTYEELREAMTRLPAAEDIKIAMQRRNDSTWRKYRAFKGVRALLSEQELEAARQYERIRPYIESLSTPRDDHMAAWDQEMYDEQEGTSYIATEECPNCINGKIADENGDADDCPVCGGDGKVLACLGFDGLPVADPTEVETSKYEPASEHFIQWLYSRVAW